MPPCHDRQLHPPHPLRCRSIGGHDGGGHDRCHIDDHGRGDDHGPNHHRPPLVVSCVIEAPHPVYDTGFYAKQCTAHGIPILSSDAVADEALHAAAAIVAGLLGGRPDLVAVMVERDVRVGIIGKGEVTTDLPEYASLYTMFPGTDWDARTRGLGATAAIPLSSGAEENLLCLEEDAYPGESIFIHELAHTIRALGVAPSDHTMDRRIDDAYAAAMASGLWVDTYAATNSDEYWAEAVQSYFDANASAVPTDGIHNDIATREELAVYDPTIHAIIAGVFDGSGWRYSCP